MLKVFSDLVGGLALDQDRRRLRRQVEQRLDVEVVGREDELEQRRVVDLAELLVPGDDVRPAAAPPSFLRRLARVLVVVHAPVDDLREDLARDVGRRDAESSSPRSSSMFFTVADICAMGFGTTCGSSSDERSVTLGPLILGDESQRR